jgi:eukaryotic-like serine/threonine-protein kinase
LIKVKPRYKQGDRIGGRYLVHQALMGGMGEVYLCLDLEQMYPYALKTFQQRHLEQAFGLRRAFEQEVLAWVALEKHPNIVRCFYMDTLDNQPFMVLEWIAGEQGKGADLRGWLRHGPLELKTVLDFAIDICRGLVHAQDKQPGIVHRDLKPENILVAQGGLAKITDFGLAQIVVQANLEVEGGASPEGAATTSPQLSLAAGGGIAGTPPYMPPEQWLPGAVLDERADIYALGCILYEMLTGQPPFSVSIQPNTSDGYGQWLAAMQAQHETAKRPVLPEVIPSSLARLIHGCMAIDRNQRPARRTELLSDLQDLYVQLIGLLPRPKLESDEFTAASHRNRGTTYHVLRQYRLALADYNRAIELDPDDAKTYSNRGLTYRALRQAERALVDFNRAIELDPESPSAYSNRGITYEALEQYVPALADLNRAIDLDPDSAGTYSNRGVVHKALGHYEQALSDYSRAIDLDPNDPLTYCNRALTHYALGDYERALADYSRAIDVDPNDAYAYLSIGIILGKQGKPKQALPYFEKAAQLGDTQGAELAAQFRKLLGVVPTPPRELVQQAFVAFQQAGSPDDMAQAVVQYTFMTDDEFIIATEQSIDQQIPPEHRYSFRRRLTWLKRIAEEQNSARKGFWGRLFNK